MGPAAIPFLLAAGTAVAAVGAISSAQAASSAAEFNATTARGNAQVALDQASAEQSRQRRQSGILIAQNKANFLGSGITLDGSPLDALQDQTANATLDNLLLGYGGKLRARGLESDASLYSSSASNSKSAGYLNSASSLLVGGAKSYDAYTRLNPS